MLALALAGALLVVPSMPASAAPAVAAASSHPALAPTKAKAHRVKVRSRAVEFEVGNTYDSTIPCLPLPDGKDHVVRGRLVGPKQVLRGRAGARTFNVLVHDSGTTGRFFNLTERPAYDYATQLAKRGQTSLVIDRLGFGQSPLADGNATCVKAQVTMLHQVVQHLYSGIYRFRGSDDFTPHAARIVVHGQGNGATLAQLEAAKYSDTSGLVLLAPSTTSTTALAAETLRAQSVTCLGGAGFAPFGATTADYRGLLFATAPTAVQRAALAHRASTPCGEVAGLASAVASLGTARKLDVPVLVLAAGRDARSTGNVPVASSMSVTRRTVAGAGSALVLERSAPATRRTVLAWLEAR